MVATETTLKELESLISKNSMECSHQKYLKCGRRCRDSGELEGSEKGQRVYQIVFYVYLRKIIRDRENETDKDTCGIGEGE